MIGRAYLWGLAANGQAGVENVLDILRGGIDSALMGLGHASVHDLSPADILVPTGSSATWVCPPDGTFSRMLSWAQIGVGPPITTEMLATE